MDDSYLQGDSYSGCLENIHATTSLLTDLGFQINYEKSLLTPTQTIRFFGFILDSVKMIISLTAEQTIRIVAIYSRLQETEFLKLYEVASVIGSFVAALPWVSHGAIHYRALERAKNAALTFHKGSFNKKMPIPPDTLADVYGVKANVEESFSPLRLSPVYTTCHSDASLEGWGGTDGVTHIGGRWTEAEMPHHINALELHAAYLTHQALGAPHTNVHIRLMLDNTTATVYINKMGGGGVPTPWSVMILPKTFGSGRPAEIPGYPLRMSLVPKTMLLISNLVILSGAYPPFCFKNFRNGSISLG